MELLIAKNPNKNQGTNVQRRPPHTSKFIMFYIPRLMDLVSAFHLDFRIVFCLKTQELQINKHIRW